MVGVNFCVEDNSRDIDTTAIYKDKDVTRAALDTQEAAEMDNQSYTHNAATAARSAALFGSAGTGLA
jgi:hypothetical protein